MAEALEDLYRGRLTGAVGTEEGEDLAAVDLEVDPADGSVVSVAFAQAADRDHRLGACG
jgi:hypothetical protein